MATSTTPRILGPRDGLILGSAETNDRFIVDSSDTGGRLAVVEHTIAPGVLAGPMHLHTLEDEFSYVIAGRLGASLGGHEVFADAGDFVFKPRGEWHTFWNAGHEPLRILEIITPGGLEELFKLIDAPDADRDAVLAGVEADYGCRVDEAQTAAVMQRHGLQF